MSQYAQLNTEATQVLAVVDLAPALVAGWTAAGNAKAAVYRLLVIDVPPVPSATQNVVSAGYVIELTQVRQTWALADKSADQIEAEALQAEKQQINGYLTDVQTQLDISNATRATLTNVQRINELEKDTRVLMKAAKFTLRALKRAL